jgi:hypothetical protein
MGCIDRSQTNRVDLVLIFRVTWLSDAVKYWGLVLFSQAELVPCLQFCFWFLIWREIGLGLSRYISRRTMLALSCLLAWIPGYKAKPLNSKKVFLRCKTAKAA